MNHPINWGMNTRHEIDIKLFSFLLDLLRAIEFAYDPPFFLVIFSTSPRSLASWAS